MIYNKYNTNGGGGKLLHLKGCTVGDTNLSTILPNYKNLTKDDFLILFKSASASVTGSRNGYSGLNRSFALSSAFSHSYNPSTGVLNITVSNTYSNDTYSDGLNDYYSYTCVADLGDLDVYLLNPDKIKEKTLE